MSVATQLADLMLDASDYIHDIRILDIASLVTGWGTCGALAGVRIAHHTN